MMRGWGWHPCFGEACGGQVRLETAKVREGCFILGVLVEGGEGAKQSKTAVSLERG